MSLSKSSHSSSGSYLLLRGDVPPRLPLLFFVYFCSRDPSHLFLSFIFSRRSMPRFIFSSRYPQLPIWSWIRFHRTIFMLALQTASFSFSVSTLSRTCSASPPAFEASKSATSSFVSRTWIAEDPFLWNVSKSTTFDVSPAYDFPFADELALENTVTALIKLSPISTLRTTCKSTGRSLAMSRLRTIFIYCSMYLFNLL